MLRADVRGRQQDGHLIQGDIPGEVARVLKGKNLGHKGEVDPAALVLITHFPNRQYSLNK
jgi:hypothetical protein